MENSYSNDEIKNWLQLDPEERLLEAEELWEEFLIKYPVKWQPFVKSFESFEDYHHWLKQQKNPLLW